MLCSRVNCKSKMVCNVDECMLKKHFRLSKKLKRMHKIHASIDINSPRAPKYNMMQREAYLEHAKKIEVLKEKVAPLRRALKLNLRTQKEMMRKWNETHYQIWQTSVGGRAHEWAQSTGKGMLPSSKMKAEEENLTELVLSLDREINTLKMQQERDPAHQETIKNCNIDLKNWLESVVSNDMLLDEVDGTHNTWKEWSDSSKFHRKISNALSPVYAKKTHAENVYWVSDLIFSIITALPSKFGYCHACRSYISLWNILNAVIIV